MSSFTKGLLTGVFGVVVGLVISGSKNQEVQDYGEWEKYRDKSTDGIGTYQLSTSQDADGFTIEETIIDTRNGKVVSRQSIETGAVGSLYERVERQKTTKW